MGVLVEVSARRFAVPHECPCCGAVPDTELAVPVSGKRAARTSAKAMDIPYCARCLAHVAAHEGAGVASAAVMLLGIAGAVVAVVFAGPLGLLVLPAAIAVAFVLVSRRRAAAAAMRGAACAATEKALAYLGWSGGTSAFELASPTYAARFAEQNDKIVINATPQLKKLLEGHARARLAVPTPAAAVDLAAPPPTVAGWIARLDAATGPAGRRYVLVRALAAISDDAGRAAIVAAAAKIDLAPTYAKVAAATSLEDRAKLLAEAIARVTADNLPALVQDAELRELESKLNALA